MIHGYAESSRVCKPLAKVLAPRFAVLALSTRDRRFVDDEYGFGHKELHRRSGSARTHGLLRDPKARPERLDCAGGPWQMGGSMTDELNL